MKIHRRMEESRARQQIRKSFKSWLHLFSPLSDVPWKVDTSSWNLRSQFMTIGAGLGQVMNEDVMGTTGGQLGGEGICFSLGCNPRSLQLLPFISIEL